MVTLIKGSPFAAKEEDFPVTTKEVMQVARAVHDEAKSLVQREITGLKSFVASRFGDLESEAVLQLGKRLDGYVTKALEDGLKKHADYLNAEYTDRWQQMQKSYADQTDEISRQVKAMEQSYQDRLSFVQQAVDASMQRLENLLMNLQLPVPVVHVDAAVVNVPAPIVNVEEKSVTVNLPAPIVNVEEKAVTVNVPPPRLTRKSFTYDDLGRPDEIREQEM